jgi:hypothetical protein
MPIPEMVRNLRLGISHRMLKTAYNKILSSTLKSKWKNGKEQKSYFYSPVFPKRNYDSKSC